MSRTKRFREQFYSDAVSAAKWYSDHRNELGADFLDAIDEGLDSIDWGPESYPLVDDDIRVCILKRFPYGIYFRVTPDELLILGVLHLHRDESAWRDRVN